MEKIRINRPLVGLFVAVLLVISSVWSLIVHITRPLGFTHGDSFLVAFILRHYMDVFAHFRWIDWTTLPMFYGFRDSLFFTEHYFLQAIIGLPLYLLTRNIFAVTHILAIGAIVGSAVAMYVLSWQVTKRGVPSITAAVIFSINPFITARFPDHLLLSTGMFLPLGILAFERALMKRSFFWCLTLFIVLSLQLAASSLHYSVFLTVIGPFYAVIRLWQERIHAKNLLNAGCVLGIAIFVIVAMLHWYGYGRAFASGGVGRTMGEAEVFSARLSDWLFTAPNNVIYGNLKMTASRTVPGVVRMGVDSEQNLFPGVTVLALFIAALFLMRKRAVRNIWMAFILVIFASLLLSLGPTVVVSDTISFPGPYGLLYQVHPLFSAVRVPARFGVFVFLGLAMTAAFTVSEFERRWGKRGVAMGAVCVVLIWAEYAVRPFSFTAISPETQRFYERVRATESVRTIVDLPLGNRIHPAYPQSRPEDLDAPYLLWAQYHRKTLLNGYSGYLPPEYVKRANLLSVNFPTREKLGLLKEWGADAILLHEDQFSTKDEYVRLVERLRGLGMTQKIEGSGLTLFTYK